MYHQNLETVRALSSGSEGREQKEEDGRTFTADEGATEEDRVDKQQARTHTAQIHRLYVSGETCGWGRLCRNQEVNQ